MEKVIRVGIGPTYMNLDIIRNHPVAGSIRQLLNDKLVEWAYDNRSKRWLRTYRYYLMNADGTLRLPVGILEDVQNVVQTCGYELKKIKLPSHEQGTTDIDIVEPYAPKERQVRVIEHMLDESHHRRGVNLQTGVGKTFCSIYTSAKMKIPTLVICSGLMKQWYEAYCKFTNAEDIYIIKGSDSIWKLLKSDYMPSVIIASLETIRNYINCDIEDEGFPLDFEGLCERYKIGLKVVDEAHLCWHAATMIDLNCRVANNIYLSGTFRQSDQRRQAIFERIYPTNIIYDEGTYNKYVNITSYSINLDIPIRKTRSPHGYSHAKYEGAILKRKTKTNKFLGHIKDIIRFIYLDVRESGEKMLLYFGTIQMIETVQKYLQQVYPELKVITYIKSDPEEKLLGDYDIVISNPKKASVGLDIPLLRSAFSAWSTAATTTVEQMLGRLRELDSGNTPEYGDLWDDSNEKHHEYIRKREQVYIAKGKTYKRNTL